jgi:glycosyltransferase involved in cell wall biosynthesis
MKILFISSLYPISSDPGREGDTAALHYLVKAWSRENNVIVIRPVYLYLREMFGFKKTRVKKSLQRREITLDDVQVIIFPIFKIPRLAYFYYPLYRYLDRYLKARSFTPGVVIAHYDKSLQIGYGYSRPRKLPLTLGLHITPDLMVESPGVFGKRCGKVLAAAAAIACRSNYIYNKIIDWFPQYRQKCFIAFSGIEERHIEEPEQGIQRLRQWKRGGKLSFISVSSLIQRKKIDTVLHALALFKDRIDWSYTIIGEGEERRSLESLATRLGVGNRVCFKGQRPREEAINAMKQSHIFVLVSVLETFGLVYLEALAAGNIVIGSRGEGIDGVIRHEIDGFLSPAGEVEPLTQVLEKIIFHLDEKELEKILDNAHLTIKQYTDRNAARNYLDRLKQIVGETRPGK